MFHVERADKKTIGRIARTNVSRESDLMTDESRLYVERSSEFASHKTVTHSANEYVSIADPTIHTNTIEDAFSIFKRGMYGTYQHCGEQHLHRYLAEFDFRYNSRTAVGMTDERRAELALAGISGRGLGSPIGGLTKPKTRRQRRRLLLTILRKRERSTARARAGVTRP